MVSQTCTLTRRLFFIGAIFVCSAAVAMGQIAGGLTETTNTRLGGNNYIVGTVYAPDGVPINTRMRIKLTSPEWGDIIATTDDDAVCAPDWIERLAAPFQRDNVMVVTGNVLPAEMESEAQRMFEAYGGLSRGFNAFVVDRHWFRRGRRAVPTWELGCTANAAFRASIFSDPEIGMIDEALGAGTPTGCSEDTYVFYRVLKAGHAIVYDPHAQVWHRHRATMKALRSQIFSYSKGHVAYQLTTWLRDGDRRAIVRLLYELPRIYAGRTWDRLRGRSDYPFPFVGLEILGCLAGPFALWRSRWRVRRLGSSAAIDASETERQIDGSAAA